jgi:hypothetical protein
VGYARLPGAGYAALHPELTDVDPEDYPDIHKMAILADVAPYSREYHQVSSSCRQQKTSRVHERPKPVQHQGPGPRIRDPVSPLPRAPPSSLDRGHPRVGSSVPPNTKTLAQTPWVHHEKYLFFGPRPASRFVSLFLQPKGGGTRVSLPSAGTYGFKIRFSFAHPL